MTRTLRQIYLLLILLAVTAIVGGAIWLSTRHTPAPRATKHTIDPARVKNITDMIHLCSLEIYEETPIKDTINGKGVFAIQRLQGDITFDLDALRIDTITPDSIVVHLPHHRVRLLESATPGSYRLVDVWNVATPLLPATLTTAEENTVKLRAADRIRTLAYRRGHIRRARHNAVETLTRLYSLLPDIHVTVVDDNPDPQPEKLRQ